MDILKVVGGLVAMLVALVLRGFTISVLWQWFLVPLGLNPVTIPLALGISLMVATLTHQSNLAKEEKLSFAQNMGIAIGSNLFILLFGWLITLFM